MHPKPRDPAKEPMNIWKANLWMSFLINKIIHYVNRFIFKLWFVHLTRKNFRYLDFFPCHCLDLSLALSLSPLSPHTLTHSHVFSSPSSRWPSGFGTLDLYLDIHCAQNVQWHTTCTHIDIHTKVKCNYRSIIIMIINDNINNIFKNALNKKCNREKCEILFTSCHWSLRPSTSPPPLLQGPFALVIWKIYSFIHIHLDI